MKIGLFFGSFNPIHIGHMIMANHFAEFTDIDEVWFVVSPQNPLKAPDMLMNEDLRLKLTKAATSMNKKFKVCDAEFRLPRPSYTIDTLRHLWKKYPAHEFVVIMGADSFAGIHKWKEYQEMLSSTIIYIYDRNGVDSGSFSKNTHVQMFDFPLLDISATYIRELLRQKKSVQFLVPDKVWKILKGEFQL